MDLKALAIRTLKVSMGIAGTAKVAVTFRLGATKTYDYDLDTFVESGGTSPAVLVVKYRTREQQKTDLTAKTATFLVEGTDVSGGIKEADTLTETVSGLKWNIDGVEPVLEGVAWIVSARR